MGTVTDFYLAKTLGTKGRMHVSYIINDRRPWNRCRDWEKTISTAYKESQLSPTQFWTDAQRLSLEVLAPEFLLLQYVALYTTEIVLLELVLWIWHGVCSSVFHLYNACLPPNVQSAFLNKMTFSLQWMLFQLILFLVHLHIFHIFFGYTMAWQLQRDVDDTD